MTTERDHGERIGIGERGATRDAGAARLRLARLDDAEAIDSLMTRGDFRTSRSNQIWPGSRNAQS